MINDRFWTKKTAIAIDSSSPHITSPFFQKTNTSSRMTKDSSQTIDILLPCFIIKKRIKSSTDADNTRKKTKRHKYLEKTRKNLKPLLEIKIDDIVSSSQSSCSEEPNISFDEENLQENANQCGKTKFSNDENESIIVENGCNKSLDFTQSYNKIILNTNPLPGFTDIVTCEEVVRPHLSPYGHVLRY